MWNGGSPNPSHRNGGATDPAALAASALAAYTTGTEASSSQAAYAGGYVHPASSMVSTYQAHAMEALRRQEEMRQQAYIALQQRQNQSDSYASPHGVYEEDERVQPRHEETQHGSEDESAMSVQESSNPRQQEDSDEEEEQATPEHVKKPASRELSPMQSSAEEIDSGTSNPLVSEVSVAEPVIDDAPETTTAVVVLEDPSTSPATPTATTSNSSSKKKKSSSTRKRASAAKKKNTPPPSVKGPTMDDPVPPITSEEFDNIEALMVQFCRVPLLAEFSRPVSLLHPELMTIYSKIVKHPMDLGTICRGIRRRTYKDTRAIQIDMWRIFTNCIKYHSHPSNRDNAVPAFISIALHLRDYFNALWQEYMMPSDMPVHLLSGKQPRGSPAAIARASFEKREKDRAQRLMGTSTTMLSSICLDKIVKAITDFINNNGKVDGLENDVLLGEDMDGDDDDGDLDAFVDNLKQFRQRVKGIAASSEQQEYSVEEMVRDLKRCYNVDLFENRSSMRVRIANRLDRLIGKILVPIYETSCRGVNQSSIWGCMAAAIWARESSKKPYWPALVLGILAPECQREDWHLELTQRNEARLPEKLLSELQAGKRKAEQSIKRDTRLGPHQHSYFLVEFMGTHEFIWVKEGDIIETFDPDEDPNLANAPGNITKKKRSSRSLCDSKTFIAALEEGRWALEEFELQLSDACGDHVDEEETDEELEMNYSYAVLSQSDDEADEDDDAYHDRDMMTASDVEETNDLLATDGLIDYSTEGRKNARKRSLARKKEEKAAAKKEKNEQAKKSKDKKARARQESLQRKKAEKQKKEDKREERERKKRRGRARKDAEKSRKKRRLNDDDQDDGLSSRRSRATAIVNGYITRLAKKDGMKNLCLAGVLNIPASVVESSGLLGMALAFRAASGEMPMPENGDGESKFKPWEEIDVDGPKTSAERIVGIEKQLDILQRKLEEVKSATAKRNEMNEVAMKRMQEVEKEIFEKEKAAKKEIMSRALKKKPVSKNEPKEEVLEGTILDADADADADANDNHTVVEVIAEEAESVIEAKAEEVTAEIADVDHADSEPVEAVVEADISSDHESMDP